MTPEIALYVERIPLSHNVVVRNGTMHVLIRNKAVVAYIERTTTEISVSVLYDLAE